MAAILSSLRNTVIAGFVLAGILLILYVTVWGGALDANFGRFIFRWAHVISGVMWIGLLWYFNFIQIPTMPSIPDEQKPAIGKHIAPKVLWWFRWGAMSTIATGLILAMLNGYLIQVLTLGAVDGFAVGTHTLLGIGMWMGIIMWFNVWGIIWPNQQKALNIADKYPDLTPEQKAAAGRTAMLFSRTNTLLSFPMLFAMVAAQNL
ncbi:MAG: urate hydroxylase PuuD [Marinicaulis sp.]|nr:urate hydroxylase PuuD [Marinicaulis sp.]